MDKYIQNPVLRTPANPAGPGLLKKKAKVGPRETQAFVGGRLLRGAESLVLGLKPGAKAPRSSFPPTPLQAHRYLQQPYAGRAPPYTLPTRS